jgi:transketolase
VAQKILADKGVAAGVVSMPCIEWFESQSYEYRDSVLPPSVSARVAVEAAVAQSSHKLVGDTGQIVSIEHVRAAAVVGVPDDLLGEEVGAVIALVPRSRGRRHGDPRLRQGPSGRLQVPAKDLVRRRAAQGSDGQDP